MLTTEEIKDFQEIEIQNPDKSYLYRGRIKDICVVGDDMCVKLAWLARGVGYPLIPKSWVKDDKTFYNAPLLMAKITRQPDLKRILLQLVSSEIVLLFQESTFDTSKVEGLHDKGEEINGKI